MEIGAAVRGNRRYIIEDALPYGGQIKVPQFVVTQKPRDQTSVGGLIFTFTESLENAINLAKSAAGERSITLLGSSTNQRALNAATGLELHHKGREIHQREARGDASQRDPIDERQFQTCGVARDELAHFPYHLQDGAHPDSQKSRREDRSESEAAEPGARDRWGTR